MPVKVRLFAMAIIFFEDETCVDRFSGGMIEAEGRTEGEQDTRGKDMKKEKNVWMSSLVKRERQVRVVRVGKQNENPRAVTFNSSAFWS